MKQFLLCLLSAVLVLILPFIGKIKEVRAYGIDYNYVDNVLNEVGYGDWYDDTQTIITSSYGRYGDFGFNGNGVARYVVSTDERLNGKTVITPMNETLFTECAYNMGYARTQIEIKEDMTEEEIENKAKAWLKNLWANGYDSLEMNLTASGSFGYTSNYGKPVTTVTGDMLAFVGLNDNKVTVVEVKVSNILQLGDYSFANYSALKELSYTVDGEIQEFPYAFAYGCKKLKYLVYLQNNDYIFDRYAFANCTSLVHWTGLGKDGAIQNWNNATISDSQYVFDEYAFAGCSLITHADFVSSNVTLKDYSFGKSGLTYIGFFDYDYYEKGDSLLEIYKENASTLMEKNSISDKAFDGVSAQRIYVAHKDIYDIMNIYHDGLYSGLSLSVANIRVTFDGTDSTGGSMEDTVIRYDDDIYTLTNKFYKEGFTFNGFGSEEMTDVTLPDNYNAPHNDTDWIDAFTCYTGVTTLYPTWAGTSYKITYVLNGGAADDIKLPDTHTYGEAVTELAEPTRYGYDFAGWYENEELTVPFGGISSTDMLEHTYYAKWEIHKILITYNLDGGINSPNNPETISYDSARIILENPTKNGYVFDGWYGENEEKVTYLLAGNGDVVLSARWRAATYSISYVLDGGTLTGEAPTSYTFGEKTYLMVPPVKDKYCFMGWYSDKALTSRVYDISENSFGNVTLYAKWSETVAILDIPSKKGYRFIGWVDGKGNSIGDTELLSSYENDIYANYLDIRWTTCKKGSKTYIEALKTDYEWYAGHEKKGDKDSFQEQSKDGSIVIYGTADGYVTKKNLSINISGKIKSVSLTRNGKKISIASSYFNKRSNNIYLNGYPIKKDGVYVLVVTSATDSKTVTFMKDSHKPNVKGVAKKTVVTRTKLDKKVKKAETVKKKKGKSVITTRKKGKTKTVTCTTKNGFVINQRRRFYVNKTVDISSFKRVTTKYTASVKWSDSVAGVSTVYINGKQLSAKKVKKGQYTFKKAGIYKIEVYDYIGNHYSQKIVIDDKNKDVTCPKCNMKNNKIYYTGSVLKATDNSGIAKIKIVDWHGFTHIYKTAKHTFNTTGTYKITIYDKAGNYKELKVQIIEKPKY